MRDLIDSTREHMQKTLAVLDKEYIAVRAGRANPNILDRVQVDYYGALTPINQMAAVSVPEARMLQIQPWDISTIKSIEKAILSSDLGLNPQNDGKVIRLAFPPLTEERRKQLVKDIHKLAEDAKVAIRNIRRETVENFKAQQKKHEITEDDLKDAEKQTQDITDKFCKDIDSKYKDKEKEIMEI
ncbi:MAG: ribosome recycling factor [Oscillospiraceae bacterium]|nr:ribosome recycling factor [Oscillospiraceae bacterium]